MASYTELRGQFGDDSFRNRVTMATIIAANNLLEATPTAADRAWASNVFTSPDAQGRIVYMAVLAANKALTIVQITGATDAAIQSNVDAVVPSLVSALAGV